MQKNEAAIFPYTKLANFPSSAEQFELDLFIKPVTK